MERKIIQLIEGIIKTRSSLINFCVKQKAKFEGWLKFELAQDLNDIGVDQVCVEYSYAKGFRADISFVYFGEWFLLELKTSNTNFRINGIEPRTRPITKNIDSIIEDGHKLLRANDVGLVVFVLFPLIPNNSKWIKYLNRISTALSVELQENKNYNIIKCNATEFSYDILISCLEIKK
ncbi:hypothetical protein QJQ58_15770 [Paenibacillus dendritiformis]|uniref:hypothetical protein n=1 Tax=Paenibacillus dendritiformis TaxID=130049 RepID=UPI00248B7C10|nr:hypothetical protein [Paenibacillus dendritiformis]WGU92070.1 hypothetical protein QJQ58_15770 [Paenibacillus dendritiformis]